MKDPLETYVLGGKKLGALDTILNTNPGAYSPFDPPDLLEEDGSTENDPYLAKLANGKRVRPCTISFLARIQSSLFCSANGVFELFCIFPLSRGGGIGRLARFRF